MERSPADVPLAKATALAIVDDLLAAFELLDDNPIVPSSSCERLVDGADEILDLVAGGGTWLPRVRALALAAVLLDDGYLPLHEYTLHQTLALALLDHHDHLIDLIDRWP